MSHLHNMFVHHMYASLALLTPEGSVVPDADPLVTGLEDDSQQPTFQAVKTAHVVPFLYLPCQSANLINKWQII